MVFSIVIPVYNAEKTVGRCLDSILAQSFSDFQVILIDDGSRDQSLSICRAYSRADERITVVHQENRGPSAARNEGLRRAAGDWLCFVDSDDYIAPDYLEQLNAGFRNTGADVLFFGYRKADREGRIIETRLPPAGLTGTELVFELASRDMFGYTWIKCFSRQLVQDTIFPEDMSLFEDEIFTLAVIEKAKSVAVLPQALYTYVTGGADMLTGRTFQNYCQLSDRVFSAWECFLSGKTGGEQRLMQKADAFTARCRYYGLERDVEAKRFFQSLAETRFFRAHTKWTALDRRIQRGAWTAVRTEILLYKWKNRLRLKQ